MEGIKELIDRFGVEEDPENIIISFPGEGDRVKRCFILKRPFIRVVYPDRHYVDYPLADVVEATVRFPEMLLSEALQIIYNERDLNKNEQGEYSAEEGPEE